ncbi:MAG: ferredoxin [Bacillota bacterium]
MPHRITDLCIACGSCCNECSEEAIGGGDKNFIIDPELCLNWGAWAEICPVEAIEENGE